MARKYHNLAGLVRDLEHAVEAGGVQEWDLLSRFDNCLLAIEEADPRLEDESGDESEDDDSDDRHDAGSMPRSVDRRARPDELIERVGAEVPRGTRPTSSQGDLPGMGGQPDAVDGANRPVTRITMTTGRAGSKRRGT